MSLPPPVVRYMILCDDWAIEPDSPTNDRRIVINGLVTRIRSLEFPPFPHLHKNLCVIMILTNGRGTGTGRVVCFAEEGESTPVFDGRQSIDFASDPTEVLGVPYRFRGARFPKPGMYSVQFWYDGVMLAQQPLELR